MDVELNGLDKLGVSVVIITLNGKDRIIPTLKHLLNQKGIDFNWEILIIDNNSSDSTGEISKSFWEGKKAPCNLRVINETRPGQMYARQCGIINSNYRYMLYVDDDNWLSSNYVQFAFKKIIKNSKIAAIGGQGKLVFEKGFSPPKWIHKYAKNLGTGPQGKNDGDTTDDKGCLYTAGAIFDRVWLANLYRLDIKFVLSGRDGKSLVGGEDTELTYLLRLMGARLYYYSELSFRHYMPPNRISWNYLLRLNRGMGRSNYLLRPYLKEDSDNLFTQYSITIALIAKYFLKSLSTFFQEGDNNMIFLNRFIGQFQVIKRGKSARLNVQSTIEKLSVLKNND